MTGRVAWNTRILADELGVDIRTIQRHCQEIGLTKIGRDYIFDAKVAAKLRARVKSSPGRPKED